MDISEVCKATGLKPSALRYYEKLGLIEPNGRNGLRRTYSSNVVRKLILIRLWQRTHFSLDDIAKLTSDKNQVDRSILLEKADALGKQIEEIKAIQKALQHIANCPEDDFFDCPSFVNYLEQQKLISSVS